MSTTEEISPTSNIVQSIRFNGSETEYVTELYGKIVNIQCGEGNHNVGSSKVKLTDRIDYNWEFKYYHGHLVAAHINGKIIAYAMKGKDGGMIRVVHQENHAKRILIKNLKEDIKDISFSYSSTEVILGCVDCEGNILIYDIEDTANTLIYTLRLHVFHATSARQKNNFKLAWCPFVPGTDDDVDLPDDSDKMFVVLNGSKAQIYNVATLNSNYGCTEAIDPDESYEGYTEITYTSELVDASFSSDGCAIALASQDGYVQFFQLFTCEPEFNKCLHKWIPHKGKSLTSIIFVDNILEYVPQCWKFAITGAENNTELKLWSCESWNCFQTIHFLPNPKGIIPDLFLNVATDYSGNYLVVSDINNRAIYVIELQKKEKEKVISAVSLANFLVPAPFLSFHILEAGSRNMPYCYSNSTEDLYDNDDYTEYETEICVQNLKMLVIQPKKFQECNVTFQPDAIMYKGVSLTTSIEQGTELKNGDLKVEPIVEKIPELDDLQNSVTLLIQQQQNSNSKLTLLTPDDLTSPGKASKSSSIRNSLTNENTFTESAEKIVETDLAGLRTYYPEAGTISAGSSPSREVQEIFSRNNSSSGFPTQEFYNSLSNIQVQSEEEGTQKDYSAKAENNLLYQDTINWPTVKDSDAIKQIQESVSSDINKQHLETIYLRMNSLETTIKDQSLMLEQLHKDLKQLNNSVTKNANQNVVRSNAKNTEEMGKELETAMAKQHLQIAKMLENLIQLQKVKDRELQDNLIDIINQILPKAIADKIPSIVQQEVKHSVLPSLHQSMDTYRLHMETQYNHKFANMDSAIKKYLSDILSSKELLELISVGTANLITPNLEHSYKTAITKTLVPSLERVCGQMFQQINETFTRGTKEYTSSVEIYMEKQRRIQDKSKDLVSQMQAACDNLKGNSERFSDVLVVELEKQFNLLFRSIQDKLMANLKEVIVNEVKHGFKNHASLIEEGVLNAVSRSRAVTPAPHVDSHAQLMSHIQQALAKRDYAEAFQVALSAENLNLVIFVCERVDINKIFAEKCLLSQSCLLALIQQLSMELSKNTDIKLKYIQAAFLALSPNYPQTKQFIPKVLKDLRKQLTLFMQGNPPLKQMTEARLMNMAVETMLNTPSE
ncbi:hypothetical protein ABEB36_002757 [Hypothenemus hampei]|uniref:Enhancer of mRNA-decapping protein 4 n=1 Tax=Hypothenemus hampei TaxID=57062 RepID=A0ABD1F6W7_HYPHA